ncbi:MAG: fluoride exporter [Acidimicrobiaceae bacterium]
MMVLLGVALAGAAGAVARSLVDGAVQRRLGAQVPIGTLVVNVAGSFILGLLTGAALYHQPDPAIRTVLGTGFCGALTTWSTLSWETVRLVEEGTPRAAVIAMVGGLTTSLVAGAAGIGLVGLL